MSYEGLNLYVNNGRQTGFSQVSLTTVLKVDKQCIILISGAE